MKKMTFFVMALAMMLGFTQCKKEQQNPTTTTTTEGELVPITLSVNGGNGSKAYVDPYGSEDPDHPYATVTFQDNDKIYVGYNNAYVGTLTYESNTETFSGSLNIDEILDDQPLHFYFLGGYGFQPYVDPYDPMYSDITDNTAKVFIGDQGGQYTMPVISYAPSKEVFTGSGNYTAKLQNKVSIMKFNMTSTVPCLDEALVIIPGLKNEVTIDFTNPIGTNNGFSYGYSELFDDIEGITIPFGQVVWAIVLPQEETPSFYPVHSQDKVFWGAILDEIPAITANSYMDEGVHVNIYHMSFQCVDLGLPSGTLWSTTILEPSSSTYGYGLYYNDLAFAWGETEKKDTYDWSNYKYGHENELTKYCNNPDFGLNGFTDDLTTLDWMDDIVVSITNDDYFDENCRIPTKDEWEELLNNTTQTWQYSDGRGMYGMLFTGSNGNSIFLPAAGYDGNSGQGFLSEGSGGYYWSSSLNPDNPNSAFALRISENGAELFTANRDMGLYIMPVRSNQPIEP